VVSTHFITMVLQEDVTIAIFDVGFTDVNESVFFYSYKQSNYCNVRFLVILPDVYTKK
jgi:hypothetical protein